MAQKPRDEWSDAYRRRIERGERRGFSKQRARGHGTPRSISGVSEYRVRTERARAAGRLTPRELSFLARQEERARYEFEPARERFEAMTPHERERVMEIQARLQRKRRSRIIRRGNRVNMDKRLADEGYIPGEFMDFTEHQLFYYH